MDLKKIKEKQQLLQHLISEIRVHWVLEECGGMIDLQEIYEDNDFIYLVLDYQESGTLLNRIFDHGKFTEKQTKIIMAQLLLAIDFLHQKGVIHRDIKLDNILINKIEEGELNVKIADFGLAIIAPEDPKTLLFEKSGTPCYIAPEILRGSGYRELCDIFSLGSVFFNLLTGFYLFNAPTVAEVLQKNMACDFSLLPYYLQHVSAQAYDLLTRMLQTDPAKRVSAKEALEHAWFNEDHGYAIQNLLKMNRGHSQSIRVKQSSNGAQQPQFLMKIENIAGGKRIHQNLEELSNCSRVLQQHNNEEPAHREQKISGLPYVAVEIAGRTG